MARLESGSPQLKNDFFGRNAAPLSAPNGAPTTADQGFPAPSQMDVLICTMQAGGPTPLDTIDFRIWFYRADAAQWLVWGDPNPPTGGVLTVTVGTAADIAEVRGFIAYADRIYVEVLNFVGAANAADFWIYGATARGV